MAKKEQWKITVDGVGTITFFYAEEKDECHFTGKKTFLRANINDNAIPDIAVDRRATGKVAAHFKTLKRGGQDMSLKRMQPQACL